MRDVNNDKVNSNKNFKNIDKLLSKASVDDIKRGYRYEYIDTKYVCLFCGKAYEKGIVYPYEDVLFEAERAIQNHIKIIHGSVFECLVNWDKKYTDLSDIQRDLLKYFYKGMSDKEIIEIQGGGSTSTIRSHRFKLKEREKQAKVFLAIMSLLEGEGRGAQEMSEILNILTQSEIDALIAAYLKKNL